MDILTATLELLVNPATLALIVLGVAGGTILGALPGVGSILGITMVLPLTFVLSTESSLGLLLGIYAGSVFGGSISAILINTPGTPQSAITLFDGYPMAQAGNGALAIGWAAVASTVGGVIATLIFLLAAPMLASVGLLFGPIEFFALGVFALTCLAVVSKEHLAKGVVAALIGLILATVGQDPMSGYARLTFDSFELAAGIGLLPLLVGLFALSEVFDRASSVTARENAPAADRKDRMQLPKLGDIWRRRAVLIKSSVIGTGIGILPGIGAVAASTVSYAEAKRSSVNRDDFGSGEPDGVIASEASNNAVTSGAMIPTLSLGIPGDPITAIMLGALAIQGVTPGPQFFSNNAGLGFFIFAALVLSCLLIIPVAALVTPVFSRILRIPEPLLLTCIVVLIGAGTYSVNSSGFDLLVTLLAGIFGLIMRKNHYPLAPLVIGFVLGPLIERSLRQGLVLTEGSFVEFLSSPIASGFFLVTALFLLFPLLGRVRRLARGRLKGAESNP